MAFGAITAINESCDSFAGVGGIGPQLNGSIMNLAWTQVSLILIAIICTVIVSEWGCAKVRHAII